MSCAWQDEYDEWLEVDKIAHGKIAHGKIAPAAAPAAARKSGGGGTEENNSKKQKVGAQLASADSSEDEEPLVARRAAIRKGGASARQLPTQPAPEAAAAPPTAASAVQREKPVLAAAAAAPVTPAASRAPALEQAAAPAAAATAPPADTIDLLSSPGAPQQGDTESQPIDVDTEEGTAPAQSSAPDGSAAAPGGGGGGPSMPAASAPTGELARLKVDQLRGLCRAFDATVGGNKKELAARLQAAGVMSLDVVETRLEDVRGGALQELAAEVGARRQAPPNDAIRTSIMKELRGISWLTYASRSSMYACGVVWNAKTARRAASEADVGRGTPAASAKVRRAATCSVNWGGWSIAARQASP